MCTQLGGLKLERWEVLSFTRIPGQQWASGFMLLINCFSNKSQVWDFVLEGRGCCQSKWEKWGDTSAFDWGFFFFFFSSTHFFHLKIFRSFEQYYYNFFKCMLCMLLSRLRANIQRNCKIWSRWHIFPINQTSIHMDRDLYQIFE